MRRKINMLRKTLDDMPVKVMSIADVGSVIKVQIRTEDGREKTLSTSKTPYNLHTSVLAFKRDVQRFIDGRYS